MDDVMEMAEREAQLLAERDFLLERAKAAGSVSFSRERWTGASSNALVEVAFGGKNDCLPSDQNDLAACYRTVLRLPAHLVTAAVLDQLARGEAEVSGKYGNEWAKEAAGWSDEIAAALRTHEATDGQ